jgi:two-component system, NarL family, sensor kinase
VRVIKNPVVQFLAVGLLAVAVIVIGTGRLSQRAAADEAIADSRETTGVLARSVAQPAIPRGLVDGRAGAIDKLDRTVLRRLLVDNVKRIKIWSADGQIIYSDETRLIGSRYNLGGDEREVLRHGGSDAEISDLSRPENRFEKGMGGLLEVYTRIRSPEGDPLLFEAYYSDADIAARRQQVFHAFRPITLGGLLLLVLVATPLLWALTSRLERAARDRERLLRAAVDASDSERRRIARDLHDGVVQDLAGTSFALAALARERDPKPDNAQRLDQMTASLRSSLRSLRSLLVEIYPADLHTEGLAAALDDLVAPALSAGVEATVTVEGIDEVPEDVVALTWRVAQEAVRNTLRHARASEMSVDVSGVGDVLVLTVADDGVGFDLLAASDKGHFGLRGMQDLIRDAGGRLDVKSSPGVGSVLRLEVTYR